jgi:uncharacterized membrane protein
MKTELEKQNRDSMTKDPRNWKGIFYFNPKDPRLLVQKISPLRGWTFNFASIYSFITLGLIIIIAIMAVLLAK